MKQKGFSLIELLVVVPYNEYTMTAKLILKKIFSIFLIFNLIFVSTAKAVTTTPATTFVRSFSIASEATGPRAIAFNNDGTKMFVVDVVNPDSVYEYTLTTGFDVSTASFVDSFEVTDEETNPRGLAFSTDGTKMFVIGPSGDDVNEYTLTTGFDVSTASFVGRFDVSNELTDPRGIIFNNDGTKMFVVSANVSDSVHEYNLSCAFKVTSSSKCDAPSKIKEVVGLIEAQIETVKNFAEKASGSALKRLSQLRIKQKDDRTSQNIDINFSNPALAQLAGLVPRSASAKLNPLQQMVPEDWAAWSEGSVSFGKIGETNLSSAQDITALNISFGADKKIEDNLNNLNIINSN